MHKQDIRKHRGVTLTSEERKLETNFAMEVTFEVWGIKKSSTKNASRVCMPSHMRVCGLRGGGINISGGVTAYQKGQNLNEECTLK